MKNFNIKYDNANYNFICECFNTRNGFKHVITLFINGIEQTTSSINYINRTWEVWDYQSTCVKAIDNLLAAFINREKSRFKDRNGYIKLTKKRLKEFENTLNNHSQYAILTAVKDKLLHSMY